MVKTILLIFSVPVFLFCSQVGDDKVNIQNDTEIVLIDNPFFDEYNTPFQTPPFNLIKTEHYLPAYTEGMKQHKLEIEAIINNQEVPTFENTMVALEKSGELLNKVEYVFENLNSANTNPEIQKISKEIAPLLSKHKDEISMNEKLFSRIRIIYQQKDNLNLSTEENMLLEKYYKDFVRRGANLNDTDKEKLKKINEELSVLSIKFNENILNETNSWVLFIEKENDLKGLPENVVAAAKETAKKKGQENKWAFTLHKPSFIPFLQYGESREIREKLFKAYINRGDNNNEFDNKENIKRIVDLRIQKAQLLGYKTHADYVLEENMAKTPEKVYEFLNQLWQPALKMAKEEAAELQNLIDKDGKTFKLEPWDWWFYAEKLKKEKYDLDEEMLRPYFKLENVLEGIRLTANKLFGIDLVERKDIPIYHEDVKVFEVKDTGGKHVGILYTDYFPRDGKRAGAWMNNYRDQHKLDGKMVHPIICNVGNFSKPTADKPALLSFDDVSTLFHEFGHALHGLLSEVTYPKLSGTSVPRDFVELPSQVMENWASHPEVLKLYAKHYQTGEVISDELIAKMDNSRFFNKGFETVELLAAAFLDMDWHTITDAKDIDVNKFETTSMKKINLIPEIVSRYRSTNFLHIFSGGYSSGYYSYAWARVLDADAFEAFVEKKNVFDKATADSYKENILTKGGSEDPMVLYKRFRGREPEVEPLLKRNGFLK